jgi:putative membrane protein
MKKTSYWFVLVPFSILAFACNSNTTQSGSNQDTTLGAKVADAANTATADVKNGTDTAVKDMKQMMSGNPDSDFVVKAITNNQNEIIMLKAGIKMGTSKELKAHAKMMLADHSKMEKKLEAYSSAHSYPVTPKDKADDELADMSSKTGNDWDKAWANKMIDGHKDNINAFEKARKEVKDDELKTMIDNAIPVFQSHLEMATTLRDNLK